LSNPFIAVLPDAIIQGLILGLIYAMIALGYTMVYGVLEMINFAHSDIFMIGGMVGIITFMGLGGMIKNAFVLITLALILAAAICGGLAIAIERLAYRPLRKRGARSAVVPMITAIGVSFLLQDFVRAATALRFNVFNMVFPSPDIFNQDVFGDRLANLGIYFPIKAVLVLVFSVAMLFALNYLVNRTKLGKAIRAVAQDRSTAALMGINPDTIISRTFLIGGALGGMAGVLFALYYTSINAYAGTLPGLKAFIAAVLGGIGNIPGAMLGGLVLGQLETLFATYLPVLTRDNFGSEYANIIVFLLLIVILVFRPQGLLGQNVAEKV
jgi:branched-chain amino acid transport system permease protein